MLIRKTTTLNSVESGRNTEFFLQEAKLCQHVLELACGTGLTTLYLAERGVHIDGVDILPNMIQYAKQKNQNENARFYVGDAMTFPSSIAYDFVYLTGNAFQAFLTRDAQNLLLENVNKSLSALRAESYCSWTEIRSFSFSCVQPSLL